MNKKLVLSVLSTAVVASMAASAMAKPDAGFYVGGQVDKYYNIDAFFNHFDEALDEIVDNLDSTTYVDADGNAASFQDILTANGDLSKVMKPARLDHFEKNPYAIVDGTGSYNPEEDEDLLPPVDGGELKVESVSAINASQIEVKFGAAVEKKSAEDLNNYTISAANVDKVKATLVDSKTVVLTLDPSDAVAEGLNQSTVSVTVSNVKSATDATKKIPNFSGKVSFLDLTVPQAVEAKLIGPGKVQVFFSEPVFATSDGGFLIDGGQYSVNRGDFDYATKSVILETGDLSLGNHTVTVNPDGDKVVKDGAGLFVAKTDIPLTVAEDTTAPTLVSGTAESQYEVVLTFDEPITGLSKEAVYHTANTADYQATSVEEVTGSNKTQWKVTFKNPLPTGNLTIYVAKEAVQDNFGNKNSQVLSTTVSVVADTTKPSVTELKVVSANRVTLTFSEDVVGADSKANYKITDKDGKLVTGYSISYQDKVATIDFTSALKEGATYNIEVTGIKDKAVVPNEMDKFTTSFTVADKTAPTVNEEGLYDKEAHKITIFFSEPMNGTDLLDKSKYTLVTDKVQVGLPSDAVVAVGPNNTSVNITLPSVVEDDEGNDITNNIKKVIVGQLRDLAGNKTAKVFTEVIVSTSAGTIDGVVADSAKTIDTRTVQFSINKPMKTIVADDFTVNGEDVVFAQYENKTLNDGTYGAVITLRVAKAWATDAKPVIKTKNTTMKSVSMYGDKFAADKTLATAADGLAPELADVTGDGKVDGKDLTYAYDAKGNVTKVTVSFTEALKKSTLSVDDFEVPGYTVADLELVGNGKQVEITLDPVVENGTSFKVNFVGSVSDENGNVLNVAKEITVLADDYAVGSEVSQAKAAVAGLFADETKAALAAGVDQAAIDAAKAKVDALDNSVTEKADLLDDIQAAQDLLDTADVAAEKAKYETTATIEAAVAVGDDVTADVVKLKNGETANDDVTVKVTAVSGQNDAGEDLLAVDADGKVTLAKQVGSSENNNTATVTITFTKGNITDTVEVDVTIEKQP
ncbi:Ig-like domain-containing protein [Brevibacillus sp. MCWH]|uniref:Ig-like domain-containing protein n=1 Tax=Brevibacillus sp. MCWH TaxID=2508871 RepID=UPI001492991C|nr:hypothetical protein [Brevibacillus sp. MCWH]